LLCLDRNLLDLTSFLLSAGLCCWCQKAGLPVGVRKAAMVLICKILALSSSTLMHDIITAPVDQSRETSPQKSVVLLCEDVGALSSPDRVEQTTATNVDDSAKGGLATPGPRDGKFNTPESRAGPNGS
jgi:hypothetical protein